MKRKVNIFIIMLIIFSLNTNTYYASSGALKSSSIKTCPNGKTYGLICAFELEHELIK